VSDEFKCRNCGECCIAFEIGPLEHEDVVTFAYKSYVDKDGDELIEKHRPEWSPDWAQMGVCVYLGEDRRCEIYENRPVVCRDFQCGRSDDKQRLLRAKKKCSRQGLWSPERFRLFFNKTLREQERQKGS
jgi:Fe-S-cluster containining protein